MSLQDPAQHEPDGVFAQRLVQRQSARPVLIVQRVVPFRLIIRVREDRSDALHVESVGRAFRKEEVQREHDRPTVVGRPESCPFGTRCGIEGRVQMGVAIVLVVLGRSTLCATDKRGRASVRGNGTRFWMSLLNSLEHPDYMISPPCRSPPQLVATSSRIARFVECLF